MGFPNYVGDDKPALIVKAYPDNKIVTGNNKFTPDSGHTYRYLDLNPWVGAREVTVPNIINITIARSFEADSATCEINIHNPTGWLSPTSPTDYAGGGWRGILLPNTVIKTYQGYGADTSQTGCWLIDEVIMNNPPGILTIRCRDLVKLLLVQKLYPPIIPDDYAPCAFCTTNDKQSNELKKDAKRWMAYTDLAGVVKLFLRVAGFDSWNVESTGIMVSLEEMSGLMLMDCINRVKEIVGYQFYVDRFGIPNFKSCKISGTTVPVSSYTITYKKDLSNITRKISDNYAFSSIIIHGGSTGGVGKVTVEPEDTTTSTTVTYTKRQIFKNYGIGYQSDTQDWKNFKQWVVGLSASTTDSANQSWVPASKRGSGVNYYGWKCFTAVFEFQKSVGIVKPIVMQTTSYDTYMYWASLPYATPAGCVYKNGSPYIWKVNIYYPDKEVGVFTAGTRRAWNKRQASVPTTTRTTNTIPGSTEIEFDELKVVSGEYKPEYNNGWAGHYMVPLRGQIRQGIHSEPALKTDAECEAMAKLIDFWANIKNNSMSLSVVGDYKHQPGDIVELIEENTSTSTTVLITSMDSKMDLNSGSWVTTLEVFDLNPEGG